MSRPNHRPTRRTQRARWGVAVASAAALVGLSGQAIAVRLADGTRIVTNSESVLDDNGQANPGFEALVAAAAVADVSVEDALYGAADLGNPDPDLPEEPPGEPLQPDVGWFAADPGATSLAPWWPVPTNPLPYGAVRAYEHYCQYTFGIRRSVGLWNQAIPADPAARAATVGAFVQDTLATWAQQSQESSLPALQDAEAPLTPDAIGILDDVLSTDAFDDVLGAAPGWPEAAPAQVVWFDAYDLILERVGRVDWGLMAMRGGRLDDNGDGILGPSEQTRVWAWRRVTGAVLADRPTQPLMDGWWTATTDNTGFHIHMVYLFDATAIPEGVEGTTQRSVMRQVLRRGYEITVDPLHRDFAGSCWP